MSKPPPSGQIEIAGDFADESPRTRASRVMTAMARATHDAAVARNVAAALAQAWRDELARPPRAPRRPGEGEVPAARFGPGDRRTGSERK